MLPSLFLSLSSSLSLCRSGASFLFSVMLLLGVLFSPALYALEDPSFEQLSQQLVTAKLKQSALIVEQLEASGGARGLGLFNALLAGELYARKADARLVRGHQTPGGEFHTVDVFTNQSFEISSKKQFKKIRVNNRLRIQLRGVIARLTLFSSDPVLRGRALNNMLKKPSASNASLLQQAKLAEQDPKLLEIINTTLALNDLRNSDDLNTRLAALAILATRLEPVVKNSIEALLAKDDQGDWIEPDVSLRAKASDVLIKINDKVSFYRFLEKVFFGLSLGSVLLLAATGLAITFGVMGVINMAHGELIMIGAYTTYVVQTLMPNHIAYSLLVAVPVAFVVSGAVGVLIERGVIRFLHGRALETLLATFGISLVLQQTVRSIFSPLNRQVETPAWMSGSLDINAVFSITYNRLYILAFALLVFFALQLILKKTSLGLNVRAVSQNRDMAKAIGIRTEWVDAMTFGLGSGIAGIAGVALSQLTNVGPNLGQSYIIDSFMVVVFGGVGNLWGTLVAGFTLGVTNKFLEPVTGAVLANIIVLVFIILFIQKRPRGLFPQKGRAAE